ncbi:MAG: hypothetical protein ACOY3H_03775 [Bacillota bacterium]|uniref:Uncharacterized protein n=2 Tax=Carboxydocella TaxID=178898 RepID=A0A1T4NW28_9FIRM|nr:hypothetical protein CFE_0957 [Carboxydocella thermautotrophica]AVX30574.1 hypothetical protein CTH_0974 [Carboxydocella thermautotrophica]SJZ83449.1 hypothetical protein SAMN02745885_01058 [Carboxydocella sporoproducens DSM 16521]
MRRQVLVVGLLTFFTAMAISSGTEAVVNRFPSALAALPFLLIIIAVGIIFDMIGVAATAAAVAPFHAKAARKIPGAKQAISLLNHADKVASFCNDVIGDICGTVSGGLGATIVFLLVSSHPDWNKAWLGTIMTGLIAAVTVGGKAGGKKLAIDHAEEIIFLVGRCLAWIERQTGWTLWPDKKNSKGGRKRNDHFNS